jgi:hypothetical protein
MVAALFPDRQMYAEAAIDALLDRRFEAEHFTSLNTPRLTLADNLNRSRGELEAVNQPR